jgi:hypothetical protein
MHVIGQTTEAGVMPTGVEGVPARTPEATEPGHMPVVKGMQRRR